MPRYVGDMNALNEERARRARAAVAFVAPGPNLTGARSSLEKAMGLRGAQNAQVAQNASAPLILATPRIATGFISPAAAARQVALARTGEPGNEGMESFGAPPANADGKSPGAREALGIVSTMLAFLANPLVTTLSLIGKIAYTTATTGKPPEKAPIAGPMAVYEMIEKVADKMGGDKSPGPGPESVGPPANQQAGVFSYDLEGNFLGYTNARPDPVDVAPAPGLDTTPGPAPSPETTTPFDADPAAGYGAGYDTGTGGSDTGSEGSSGSAAP